MFRQRIIHDCCAVFVFFVFSLLSTFSFSEAALASSGFSVSAVQGNIVNGKLDISRGDKVSLVVKSGGLVVNAGSVRFVSSKKRVASVSPTGVVRAKKKGSTVITVTYSGSSCRIMVKVKTSKITMYCASTGFNLTLNRAQMQPSKFSLAVKYKNKKKVAPSKVAFSTSNASVATVDRNGIVTLKAPGTVTLQARYKKKTGKCTIHVTGKNVFENKNQAGSDSGKPSPSGGSGGSDNSSTGSGNQAVAPGGRSGSSGSTGATETEPEYPRQTKQKYTYRLEFVNKTALCTGYECVLHVITDNPDLYDNSIHGMSAGLAFFVDGKASYGQIPAFDDIKYTGYNKVSDGYMYCFTFDTPGYHSIAIKEHYFQSKNAAVSGTVYDYYVDTTAKITFNVLDASVSEENFCRKMLQEHKGADDRRTLANLEEYFRKNFKYQSYYVDGNGSITRKLNLLANYGPWWLTFRDITCYDATEIMINFANRLGYVAKPFDTGMKDHRVAWVYFDSSKVNVPGFDESCMEAYDACPVGTNNNYNAETFTYLY